MLTGPLLLPPLLCAGPVFIPRSKLQNADLPPSLRLPTDAGEEGPGTAGEGWPAPRKQGGADDAQ